MHSPSLPDANTVYLALGSNLGNRSENMQTALHHLQHAVRLLTISSLYETEPVGYLQQPYFLNLVCQGETALPPRDLLNYAKQTETAIGRLPTFRNGPRPIDIDILLYQDLHVHLETLTIPHPRMLERAFVLVPLAEIAPDLHIPGCALTVAQLAQQVNTQGITRFPTRFNILAREPYKE